MAKPAVNFVTDARFTEQLPYRAYDKDKKLFVNTKSLMMLKECPLLSGANSDLIRSICQTINDIADERLFLRVWRFNHRRLQSRLDAIYAEGAKNGGMFAEIAKNESVYFTKGLHDGLATRTAKRAPVYDCRVFFEFSMASDASNQEKVGKALSDLVNKVVLSFANEGLKLSDVDENDFIALMRGVFVTDDKMAWNYDYDELMLINEQVKPSGITLLDAKDAVMVSCGEQTTALATLGVEKLPKEFYLWNAPNLIALLDKDFSINVPHVLSMTIRFFNHQDMKAKAGSKSRKLEELMGKKIVSRIPRLKSEYNDWKYIYERLDSDEVRIVESNILLTLHTGVNELKKEIENAKQLFSKSGMEISHVPDLQMPLLLANTPAMLCEGMWQSLKFLGMVRKITSFNAVNLMPIVGDWKGTYTGVCTTTLRGQFSSLDILSDAVPTDNNNFAIAAGSGAGKSVFMQKLITHELASGAFVYVIDKGDSYKNLALNLGQVYLDGRKLRLNPFTYLDRMTDPEAIKLQFGVIAQLLMVIAYPNENPGDVVTNFMFEAVQRAYDKAGTKTKVDDVQSALADIAAENKELVGNYDRRILDTKSLLDPYNSQGAYSRYFNEPNDIPPDAQFVVLELGTLDDNPNLQRAVLFSLINIISQTMYLTPRHIRKMALVDEAWSLFDGGNDLAAEFMNKGYRTSRKHGGSFGTIVQSLKDYLLNKVTRACWENSDIRIIMRQNQDAFQAYIEDNPNTFSEYEQSILRGFKPAKEVGYSSFMLRAGSITGFYRLFLEPRLRVLFSTDPKQFAAFQALTKQGVSPWEAADTLAKRFYPEEMAELVEFEQQQKEQGDVA